MAEHITKQYGGIGIYARVSTQEQAVNGYSIDMQVRKNKSYVELFDISYSTLEVFVDDGVSAKNVNRKGLKELFQRVEQGIVKTIIIYKLDRLSRSVVDVYNIISFLTENNCNLISVMDNIDLSTANGRLIVGILAIFAQWEREVIVERTMDGMAQMVVEGKYPFKGAPFGCTKDENLHLHINEYEKEILEFIIDQIIGDTPLSVISNELQDKYQIDFDVEKIKRLVKNNWLYGELYHQGKVTYGIIPVLISREKVLEARLMLEKRRNHAENDIYFFGNKVRCRCGEILVHESTKKKSKRYYYYKCTTCGSRINQNILLDLTLYEILKKVESIENSKLNKRKLKKLDRINQKILSTNTKFDSGIIDYKTFVATMYKYEYDREHTLKELKLVSTETFINWDHLSNSEKKTFLDIYLQKIVVDTHLKMVLAIEMKE